jgi:hypothetical protein
MRRAVTYNLEHRGIVIRLMENSAVRGEPC